MAALIQALYNIEQAKTYSIVKEKAYEIHGKLNTNLDKMIARELFSEYKRSPMGAEWEQARKTYLDHNGITASFRTDT